MTTDLMDNLTVTEAPDFKTPDHTASTGPTDRIREAVTGRARLATKPRATSGTKERKTRTIEPPSREGEFTESLESFYTMLATLALPFDPMCAGIVLEVNNEITVAADGSRIEGKHFGKTRARICAESLDAAAQKSEGLRRILRMITTGGVWGGVIAAHVPIIMAILSHHTPLVENVMSFQARRMEQMMERMGQQE